MNRVVLLSGPIASGKTSLARNLSELLSFEIISTSEYLSNLFGTKDRKTLQRLGKELGDATNGDWTYSLVSEKIRLESGNSRIVVDSVRTLNQIHRIKEGLGEGVACVYLYADPDVLEFRYNKREGGLSVPYAVAKFDPVEASIDLVKGESDVLIDSSECSQMTVFNELVSKLRGSKQWQ